MTEKKLRRKLYIDRPRLFSNYERVLYTKGAKTTLLTRLDYFEIQYEVAKSNTVK